MSTCTADTCTQISAIMKSVHKKCPRQKDKGLWKFRKGRDGESEKTLSQTGHLFG